jgi:hypothetical protein
VGSEISRLTWEGAVQTARAWSGGEGRGIPGGAVKCVEIRRNTDGEGSVLAAR